MCKLCLQECQALLKESIELRVEKKNKIREVRSWVGIGMELEERSKEKKQFPRTRPV